MCYKSNDFINLQVLPHYLMKLISKWYQNQSIHLLALGYGQDEDEFDGFHGKINVDDLLA